MTRWTTWTRPRPAQAALAVAVVLMQGAVGIGAQLAPHATVEGITEYRLDNGLKVLLCPDPSQSALAVTLTYHVGAADEAPDERGLALLTAYMFYAGTDRHPKVRAALEEHGADFDLALTVDHTQYLATLPASQEHLSFAVELEADRMVNTRFTPEKLATELAVLRGLIATRESDPSYALTTRLRSTAYTRHPYGRPVLGTLDDLEHCTLEKLQAFYRKHYQPDNATLVIAGNFESEAALATISKEFGALPRPARTITTPEAVEPAQDGERDVTVRRAGDTALVATAYHIPAAAHPDFAALDLLRCILLNEPGGRLPRALIDNALSTRVACTTRAWVQPGLFEIFAYATPEQPLDKVREVMHGVLDKLAREGVTEEEVERARANCLLRVKRCQAEARPCSTELGTWAALGDWRLFFIHRDRLQQLTAADVSRVAQAYLRPTNRTTGMFIPSTDSEPAAIPAAPDVSEVVTDYQGRAGVSAGEAFLATVPNIEAHTERVTLAPGIHAALLPKRTRGQAVEARLLFKFGNEQATSDLQPVLIMLPPLLERGCARYDYQQLRDELGKLQSRISFARYNARHSGPDRLAVALTSDRTHLAATLELLGEMLKQPTFPADQFDLLLQERLRELELSRSNPQARAITALRRAALPYPPEFVHYVPTLEQQHENLQTVTRDRVQQFYRDNFGAGQVEISIVGDFDPEPIKKVLTSTFGAWPNPTPYARIPLPLAPACAAQEAITTPGQKVAWVVLAATFDLADTDPDYPALALAVHVLGQGAKSRLASRLRFEQGVAYVANGILEPQVQDQWTALVCYAVCTAANTLKAEQALLDEYERWVARGITPEELEAGKRAYLQQFNNQLTSDRFVADELARILDLGRTLQFQQDLVDQVKKLKLADVNRVVRKRLGAVPLIRVKAGDLAQAVEPPPKE